MPLVAFRVGNAPFYTYTLLLDAGLLLAVASLALEGRRRGWSGLQTLETLAWALVPALLAGRLAYLAGLGLLSLQPQPWGEGLSFAGALAGGALGLAALSALRRRPLATLVGAVVPGLALGQALGWLGAAAHGASAGVALPPAVWWAPHLRDIYGIELTRFPLQYLAAALSLATWAIVAHSRLSDAGRVAVYAVLACGGLAALTGQLDQHRPWLASLSLDQVIYLGLALAGLAVLLARLPALGQAQRGLGHSVR